LTIFRKRRRKRRRKAEKEKEKEKEQEKEDEISTHCPVFDFQFHQSSGDLGTQTAW
jgi:hypothetical protein